MTALTDTPISSPKKLNWPKIIGGGIIFILLMALVGYLVGSYLRPYQIRGTELNPSLVAQDFTFTSSRTGEPVSLSDFRGKVVLLYFGYTHCPDVCPTTLGEYAQAFEMLDEQQTDQIQFLWITVDPDRDTAEIMEDYISHFNDDFMGLIPPSEEALSEVAKDYFVHYQKQNHGSETGYLVDHTASVMLIDDQGMWHVMHTFGTPAEDLAADISYFVDQIGD